MRTFTAPDMQAAMMMAKEELGDEAVILSTDKENGGGGVVVTFAVDDALESERYAEEAESYEEESGNGFDGHERDADYNSPAVAPTLQQQRPAEPSRASVNLFPNHLEELLRDIWNFHRLPEHVQQQLLEAAGRLEKQDNIGIDALREAIAELLRQRFEFSPIDTSQAGTCFMFVGAPGVGKTLCVAKLAAQWVMERQRVVVMTTDTKRAGGVEQLSAFTNILGLELKVIEDPKDLRYAIEDTHPDACVVIDSAGCNPYVLDELREVSDFCTAADAEPIWVCPAGIDPGEAEEMASVFSFLGIERLLITRVDTARRLGSILSAALSQGYGLCNAANTSQVTGELKPLDATLLADMLIRFKRERMGI